MFGLNNVEVEGLGEGRGARDWGMELRRILVKFLNSFNLNWTES